MNTEYEIPWPALNTRERALPQRLAIFHAMAVRHYGDRVEHRDRFDVRITNQNDADIPVTLICDWGHDREEFLFPRGRLLLPVMRTQGSKETAVHIADFMGNDAMSIGEHWHDIWMEFHKYALVDSYGGRFKFISPAEPYTLETRMEEMSMYRFVLIVQRSEEDDWCAVLFVLATTLSAF